MKTKKLNAKYTSKEVAESFIFRTKLTPVQKKESDSKLKEMRAKNQEKLNPNQILFFKLLRLKYQIEDYAKSPTYDVNRSFSYFLREYVKSLNKRNKDFASDLDIDETELSQVLNRHRNPSDKLIIRLEIHSNETIPAITWYRLLEKEKEQELLGDFIRKNERKHVKNGLRFNHLMSA